ncbi:MAG: hypothetical protein ACYS7Y_20175 [Planctomycetota bacterium]|jgi:hypothetical protein
MNKRDRAKFVKGATDLIEKYGGVPGGFYDWEMETKYGKLYLRIDNSWSSATVGPGTVFTRFDEPKRASQDIPCNEFSGKWNHHYFRHWTVQQALTDLEYQLRKVGSEQVVYAMLRDGGPDDLFVLFPEVAANNFGTLCSCLCMVGGHTGADYHKCIRASRPAKGERAERLMSLLNNYGYKVKVIDRCTQRMHENRMKEALA